MADTYISMAQADANGTEVVLYTCPAGVSFIQSSLIVCNTTASGANISARIGINGAGQAPGQWIYSNTYLAPNTTFVLTAGITMKSGDVMYVNGPAGVSFQLGGVQVS